MKCKSLTGCSNNEYHSIHTYSEYCKEHLIQLLTNLTDEDIKWIVLMLEGKGDMEKSLSINEKLKGMMVID